jgi:hypothetical protein
MGLFDYLNRQATGQGSLNKLQSTLINFFDYSILGAQHFRFFLNNFPLSVSIFSFLKEKRKGFLLQSGL